MLPTGRVFPTSWCQHEVLVWAHQQGESLRREEGMATLIRSKDRKVANSVTAGGGVRIANTFGLPSGKAYSCPNATSICEKVCYAGKLEKIYKGTLSVLMRNWAALQDCGDDIGAITTLLAEMITEFRQDCDKKQAEYKFRIHWDGDFYSPSYAQAWREVILANPDITFWVYTRVPSAVEILTGLPNLSLYFSTDADNRETAISLRNDYGVKLAWLDSTFEQGKSALAEIGIRAPRCPENNKALALISPEGSACSLCSLCIQGRRDVLFSISKK